MMRVDTDEQRKTLGLRPDFWAGRDVGSGSLQQHSLNLRRLWKITVLIMALVSIAPLVVAISPAPVPSTMRMRPLASVSRAYAPPVIALRIS